MASSTEYLYRALSDPLTPSPRQFKKHKTLPRPANEHDLSPVKTTARHSSDAYSLVIDPACALASSAATQSSPSSSPHTLRQTSRRLPSSSSVAGPDLPPTPPAHSRASSSGHPTLDPSNPAATTVTATEPPRLLPALPLSLRKPPVTPPDQRSPPTPDVTPPQPQTSLHKTLRQPLWEQASTGATPTDSRNDSFKTAQEEPFFSEDDHAHSAIRSRSNSAQTSQTTILRVPDMPPPAAAHIVQPVASALDPPPTTSQQLTPRTMNEFRKFDGDFDPIQRQLETDRRQERQQDGSRPQVVVSKRKRPLPKTPIVTASPAARREVIENNLVTPTAAARAARHAHVRANTVVDASPVSSSVRSASETSASVDARRSSATSARSSSSAVVEVLVMDGPSQQPQRRRTLRHVKKQNLLRQSVHAPERTSGSTLDGHKRLPQPPPRKRRESPVSRDRSRPPSAQNTSSNHHIGDSKARREIWSNGGIPVIVVPDRRSSNHGKSREPSLRSTSSRRSKRSASVGSPQRTRVGSLDMSRPDSLQSRGRDLSKPARDERTMDFAPPIPPRSSSLSAPTSRNASRTTSLTTESIRAHNAMQKREDEAKASRLLMLEDLPTPALPLAPLPASPRRAPDAHLHRDSAMDLHHSEDAMSTKKYSSRNTPFSVASVATTGTVPEVSEALEVHMYAHQNSSVVMVNHSSRPSDSPTAGFADEQATPQLVPTITTTRANDGPPSTPPKQMTKISDIDSPLRNPRVPPEPPAHPPVLNLIPATPSGTTPSYESEQKLGNYFEISPPRRRPSLIQRAFSRRRRNSVDYPPTASKPAGRLTRSFSLSRSIGLSPDLRHREDFETDIDGEMSPKRSSKEPAEKDKLHPFWRPQFDDQECEYGDSCPHHSKRDMIYRYPLVDNRPRPPKRSLTARMKNTFAIMPIRNNENEEQYPVEESIHWPERRIIRRTPSGNLRVMQRRASLDSSPTSPRPERHHAELRPSTDMDQIRRPFWRAGPLRRAETADAATTPRRTRRFSLSDKLEDIPHLPWHLTEKRREKRTQELRQMISAPTQVRDGVGDVIRHGNTWGDKEAFNANPSDF